MGSESAKSWILAYFQQIGRPSENAHCRRNFAPRKAQSGLNCSYTCWIVLTEFCSVHINLINEFVCVCDEVDFCQK